MAQDALSTLKQLFSDTWGEDDLRSVLDEVNNDLDIAIARISEGHVQPWSTSQSKKSKQVQKKSEPAVKKNKPGFSSVKPKKMEPSSKNHSLPSKKRQSSEKPQGKSAATWSDKIPIGTERGWDDAPSFKENKNPILASKTKSNGTVKKARPVTSNSTWAQIAKPEDKKTEEKPIEAAVNASKRSKSPRKKSNRSVSPAKPKVTREKGPEPQKSADDNPVVMPSHVSNQNVTPALGNIGVKFGSLSLVEEAMEEQVRLNSEPLGKSKVDNTGNVDLSNSRAPMNQQPALQTPFYPPSSNFEYPNDFQQKRTAAYNPNIPNGTSYPNGSQAIPSTAAANPASMHYPGMNPAMANMYAAYFPYYMNQYPAGDAHQYRQQQSGTPPGFHQQQPMSYVNKYMMPYGAPGIGTTPQPGKSQAPSMDMYAAYYGMSAGSSRASGRPSEYDQAQNQPKASIPSQYMYGGQMYYPQGNGK